MATLDLDLGMLPEGCTLSFTYAQDRHGYVVTLSQIVYNGWTEGAVTAEAILPRENLLRGDRHMHMKRMMLGLMATLRTRVAERTGEAPAPLTPWRQP